MRLGELIKKYRYDHYMSMDSFAKASGLSKAYISMLENNKNPNTGRSIAPSTETLKAVAKGMNISIKELFDLLGDDAPFHTEGEQQHLENASGYYIDPKTAEIAQQITDSKELSALFDVGRGMSPEDLQTVYQMALALKRKEQG